MPSLDDLRKRITSVKSTQKITKAMKMVAAAKLRKAQENGTKIVMDVKMVMEPTRIPPHYIAYPVPEIMEANPETGLINDMLDIDGFSRKYSIAGYMAHNPEKAYLTLGLKCVKAYLDIPDDAVPEFDSKTLTWNFGSLNIKAYGKTNNFLVNYYGPPSGYKVPGIDNIKPWGTFPRFSLAQILDTKDYELPEDLDWMSQFMPGEIPDWILAIDDQSERDEMMELMGIGNDFDITQSPFYNKIVILGVNVEVLHDVKSTPFYNYMDMSQLTPGMETHANAIQTIIHNNYIPVLAHPERYRFFQNDFKQYHKLKKVGCLFQVNLLSAVGHYGYDISKILDKMLADNLIDFVGSDIHNKYHMAKFNNKIRIREIGILEKVIEKNRYFE